MFPPQTNGLVNPKSRLECYNCQGRWRQLSEGGLSVVWGILPQNESNNLHNQSNRLCGMIDAQPQAAARGYREAAAHEVTGLNGSSWNMGTRSRPPLKAIDRQLPGRLTISLTVAMSDVGLTAACLALNTHV
jgi:hypothetical protein